MIKFAMLLLTLFTVLGGMILGWLARRYWLGGEWCGSLESHPIPKDGSSNRGLVAGAIGTLAAGTAAMRYANSEGDAEDAQDAGRSDLLDSKNKADGSGDICLSEDQAATMGAAANSGADTQSAASTGATSGSFNAGSDTSSDAPAQGNTGANLGASLATDGPNTISSGLDERTTSQNNEVNSAAGFMSGDQSAAQFGNGGAGPQSFSNDLKSHSGGMSDGGALFNSSDASTEVQSASSGVGDADLIKSDDGASVSDAVVETEGDSVGSGRSEIDKATAVVAGAKGAALAGVAAASTTEETSSEAEASNAELEAARAEVRALRKRLGLSDDVASGASGMTANQKLAASREEASKLRQDLWSKEQAAEGGSGQKGADTAETASTDFGGLSSEESEAERLLASVTIPKGPSNKLDAPTPGYDNDDLTKIRGIGKPTQARLNRHGIYYYDQVAGFTGPDIAWADRTLNLEGRVVSDRWIPQAKLLAGDVRESAPADEGEGAESVLVDVPSELSAEEVEAERLLASGEEIAAPAIRLEAPRAEKSPDDLTKIKGIGPKINGKLNDQGIYYYDQIAGFSGSDLAWADRELDFKGRAVRDRWVPQARGLMDAAAALEAGDTEPTVIAPAGLLSKPIEGRDSDDLTAIKGVGLVLQKQLNDKGIYYYSQIADFTDSDQEWANQALGFPGRVERDNWVPQARDLMNSPSAGGRAARVGALANAGRELDTMSEGGEVGAMSAGEAEAMRLIESGEFVADANNRPAGLLSSASQGAKDDLQRIKGVGPRLEDLLNSLGIYYFRQISNFSPSDIAWVDSKLRFKGRIIRDRWVDQAKRLS